MDTTIVIVIVVLLLLAAGGGAYAYHAVSRPLAAVRPGGSRIGRGNDGAGALELAARPEAAPAGTAVALAEVGGLRAELERLRAEARTTSAEVDSGLGRLRERRDAVLAEAETLQHRHERIPHQLGGVGYAGPDRHGRPHIPDFAAGAKWLRDAR